MHAILKTPESGERKTGDLEGFRVHKFKFHKQEYLMAYIIQRTNVLFYMTGVHENFYKDLKSYTKEVD